MADELTPIRIIKEHVLKIADEKGFEVLHFGMDPSEEGDPAKGKIHLAMRYDPEKELKPEIIMVQVDQAMTEEAERAYNEKLERDAAEARRQLEEDEELQRRLRDRKGFL